MDIVDGRGLLLINEQWKSWLLIMGKKLLPMVITDQLLDNALKILAVLTVVTFILMIFQYLQAPHCLAGVLRGGSGF